MPADLKLDPDGKLRYDDMNKVLFWYGPMSEAQLDAALKLSADETFQKAIRRFHEDSQPKQLAADFIFVGSGFVNDPEYGERYLAEREPARVGGRGDLADRNRRPRDRGSLAVGNATRHRDRRAARNLGRSGQSRPE